MHHNLRILGREKEARDYFKIQSSLLATFQREMVAEIEALSPGMPQEH